MHQELWLRKFSSSEKVLDITAITVLCVLGIIVVNPIGDFPLADDWSYGWTLRHFLSTGNYLPAGTIISPIISNVIWGGLFCLPKGFSFTAVRLSSLVAMIFAAIGCYMVVREINKSRVTACFIAMMLVFNPIFYYASFTYDTDTLFVCLMVWATLLFVKDIKHPSIMFLLAASGFACAATLSRHLGFCVPLAFAIAILLGPNLQRRTVLRALTPLAICLIAFVGFRYWLSSTERVSGFADDKTIELLRAFLHGRYLLKISMANTFVNLVYVGLFLLPITVLSLCDMDGIKRGLRSHPLGFAALLTLGIAVMCAGAFVRIHSGIDYMKVTVDETDFAANDVISLIGGSAVTLPMTFDAINREGIGPFSLNPASTLPIGFWVTLTVFGIFGALLLVARVSIYLLDSISRAGNRVSWEVRHQAVIFLILTGAVYLLPLMCCSILLDRYPMPAIAFFGMGIAGMSGGELSFSERASHPHRWFVRILSAACLIAFALYSVTGTHDNLSRNRVRWAAFRDLTRNQLISPESVDGGEFVALYPGDVVYPFNWDYDLLGPKEARGKYSVSFEGIPAAGYVQIKEYEYRNWLPPQVNKVLVLQKR